MVAGLAVIIVNYNTPELVSEAVASLLATRGEIPLEIVVIDNASRRGDLRAALAPHEARCAQEDVAAPVRLQVIYSERNLGFTGGNNLGIRNSSAPILMLLNSDATVCPGCLQSCLDYLAKHPEVGVLGPKLLDPQGTRQLSCRRFPSFRTALFNRYSFLTRLFPNNRWSQAYLMSDPSDTDEPRPVDWVSGAAMLLTRRVYDVVGPLDEAFFMYAEDVDYCLRVHQAGFEVHYLPRAEVVHRIAGSSRLVPFQTIWWRHRSMWTFYYKHYSRRIAFFDLITLAGISARALIKIAETALSGLRNRLKGEAQTP